MDKKNFCVHPADRKEVNTRWFVWYYQIDLVTAKRVRIKHYISSKHKTLEAKNAACDHLIDVLCGVAGDARFKWSDLMKHLRDAANGRAPWLKKKQLSTYHYRLNMFERYLKHSGNTDITGFVAYLATYERLTNTTINHYVKSLKTLFGVLVQNGMLKRNPCDAVRKLKERRSHGRFFTLAHRSTLKEAMRSKAPELIMPTKFIYYCCIRPDELRRLRIANLNLDAGVITVSSDVAKDAEQRIINIPDVFLKELLSLQYHRFNPECFLVSFDGYPGAMQLGKNYLYKHHRKLLKSLKFEAGYYLYSWKHTGNYYAQRAGVPIKELQLHNGHSDLRTTDNYFGRMVPADLTGVKTLYPEY